MDHITVQVRPRYLTYTSDHIITIIGEREGVKRYEHIQIITISCIVYDKMEYQNLH